MSSFYSMREKLLPLGIYTDEPGSELYCEQQAFAAGLDLLFEQLEEMEAELFISTAETYGLSEREKLFGRVREDLTLSQRRELLCKRELMNFEVLTLEAFGRVLESWGVSDYSFVESLTRARLTVRITDALDETQQRVIEERANIEIPAHAEVRITYGISDE